MNRHVLLLDLVDDPQAIARYEAWHAAGAIPPAIAASIRAADISAMEIYRLGTRLVMVMETGAAFCPTDKTRNDAADPDVAAWERLMATVQRPVPDAKPGEKWAATTRIFSLDQQSDVADRPDR